MCKSIFKVFKSLVYRKIFCLSGPKVRRDDHDEEEEVNYPAPLLSSGSDNHQHCIDIHTVPVVVAGPGGGDDDDNNNNKGGEQIRHPAAPAPAPVPFPFLFPGSSDDLDEIVVEVEDISKNILKEDYNSRATTTTDLLVSRLFGDNRLNYVNNGHQNWKPCFNNGHYLDLYLGGVVPTSTSTSTDSICNTSAAAAIIIDLDDLDDREEEEDQCSIIPIKNEKKKNKTKLKKKKSCNIIDSLLHPNPHPNQLGQTTRCGYDVSSVKGKDKQQHIQNINGDTTSTTSNAIIRGEKKKSTSPPLFLHHHRYLGQAQCGWSVNEEATSKQHHIHNVNTNGGQKKKTTAAASDGIIKWVGLYNNSQSILAVGEGDFSFSASLAIAFGSASNMIATSLDKNKFLLENYTMAKYNLDELRKRGCVVKHNVNATTMATDELFRCKKFDRIIYNFPYAGLTCKLESKETQISLHQALVRGFLANVKKMLAEDGQIHITHKCNGFHFQWQIVRLACSEGLQLLKEVPFKLEDYPGYNTKLGFGGDGNFNCYPSKTYIFVLRDWTN